jgi:hypothetical protein
MKYEIISLGGGFLAGYVANKLWESAKLFGYGVKAIGLTATKSLGVDDLILIAIGALLALFGYWKNRLLMWFGAGWILAQAIQKTLLE